MKPETPWKDPGDQIRLAKSVNQFGFRLFDQIGQASCDNLLLSPSGIATAIAMTMSGAAAETLSELTNSLGFPFSDERVQTAFVDLAANARPGGVEFRSANRIWGQQSYHFLPEFLRTTRESFGAELGEVDFQQDPEAARQQINAWVAAQTADCIPELIPPQTLNPMSRLVLTNAIYFLGAWEYPFSAAATSEEDFFASPERAIRVPMMRKSRSFSYGENESLQLLNLPYQRYSRETIERMNHGEKVSNEWGDISMLIFLPRPQYDVISIVRQLALEGAKSLPQLRHREVDVFLPRFQIDSSLSLGATLQRLGVKKAFTLDADFSRMSDDPEGLLISDVLHQAFIKVDEEGTEAAAATAVMHIGGAAYEKQVPVEFRADRPFLFAIQDNWTQSIHFLGRYMG
ncbi:serpin family protein [Blastopirellula sp. JC732]|uniref:Serpin family protein n=1 Tax=Blastopirellula sediminis TaxID=2894196 RepID=A0A9X1MJI9_9BACT|nr:serpin family protein [Blastopirellula sediminis]MCC9609317.1 serpin family protein [Blastopirellula sediminis]MCC9627906.1 serpin family protein [Blastopirellula sediminis]